MSTTDKLNLLLSIVPLIYKNNGITLTELQKLTGHKSKKELQNDLNKMIMIGQSPFGPGDYLDIQIDEKECVTITLTQGLDRPLDLTPKEWTVIEKLIRHELSFQPAGTTSASFKNVLKQLSSVPIQWDSYNQDRMNTVKEALERKKQLNFSYGNLKGEKENRTVDPWTLFSHNRSYYLMAFCHNRKDVRTFHIERISTIVILSQDAKTIPDDVEERIRSLQIFSGNSEGHTCKISFHPSVRTGIERIFGQVEVEKISEETFTTELQAENLYWFRAIIRSFGPRVTILHPESIKNSFVSELKRMPLPKTINSQ